jgi:uncharacterized membrane protein YidH (DUF202 family)
METPEGIQMRDLAIKPVVNEEDPASQPETEEKQRNFWSRHIRIIIEEDDCRDHLALERTYLAYVRTASAYAQFGVTLAQLFRLNSTEKGIGTATTLRIGNALGATTEGIAILISLLGAAYFMKQQSGILKGVIISRGWDIITMASFSFAVS